MSLRYQENCENVDWERVRLLLQEVGMSSVDTERHRKSFENSYSVVFVFDDNKMVGMGRSISDGVRQSALYDIAIDPQYQGQGIGKEIVERLMKSTPECTFMLYSSPGKEEFYRKLKYKKMKTGMILFSDYSRMNNMDFIEE